MQRLITPIRRSRNGCIDCRKAKVKCDEIRPSCGTCARRKLVCRGYKMQAAQHSRHSPLSLADIGGAGKASVAEGPAPGTLSKYLSIVPTTEAVKAGDASPTTPSRDESWSTLSLHTRTFSLLPPGIIPVADQPRIELYFNRHPFELLIGPEFVGEMNANVVMMMHQDPLVAADTISAIGYSYEVGNESSALLVVLNRRAKILANLRNMKPSSYYFEEALFMLLGLCAMEVSLPGHHATIPAVLSNVASLIAHHVSTGGEVSSVAKYYLRALARQDLIVSLVHLHRVRIPSHVWIEDKLGNPDRLLGCTAGLMPLLEELCALAEEVRDRSSRKSSPEDKSYVSAGTDNWLDSWHSDLTLRAESIRKRLDSWKPTISDKFSFRSSRKFRAQAASYRAGALLYLHRLFQPPCSSLEADSEALSKAHEVMLYTSGPATESKMLLWPVFMAACEMSDADDRAAAVEAFDAISSHRKTVTVERTKKFVKERVWKARDEGRSWNWMILAAVFPGECLPI
ncbi:hypothetical protein LX32DRAFT_717503 [Colletotrichum zoysiae]|uniref:Zn(2)-C6 fungal-type domain-containing protein n=1 Tax=Colletotrichum zoysiae TaxID=1216348 RepID=A0AAD9HIZ9_9PEZI|nr:hypothetical protein LX32DRAFT_717503 [Colletotrichum zoysiae]